MKAMTLQSFGGPEAFELRDVPTPVPHAGQVLVRVHATSGTIATWCHCPPSPGMMYLALSKQSGRA